MLKVSINTKKLKQNSIKRGRGDYSPEYNLFVEARTRSIFSYLFGLHKIEPFSFGHAVQLTFPGSLNIEGQKSVPTQ
jgi:hypothetical protein